MSDTAFKTAAYPSYSTDQLRKWIEDDTRLKGTTLTHEQRAKIVPEIARREKRDAGDVSVMTDGERLRHARASR